LHPPPLVQLPLNQLPSSKIIREIKEDNYQGNKENLKKKPEIKQRRIISSVLDLTVMYII